MEPGWTGDLANASRGGQGTSLRRPLMCPSALSLPASAGLDLESRQPAAAGLYLAFLLLLLQLFAAGRQAEACEDWLPSCDVSSGLSQSIALTPRAER